MRGRVARGELFGEGKSRKAKSRKAKSRAGRTQVAKPSFSQRSFHLPVFLLWADLFSTSSCSMKMMEIIDEDCFLLLALELDIEAEQKLF